MGLIRFQLSILQDSTDGARVTRRYCHIYPILVVLTMAFSDCKGHKKSFPNHFGFFKLIKFCAFYMQITLIFFNFDVRNVDKH